jgi:DNA-binding XRE family transcriptional regulator
VNPSDLLPIKLIEIEEGYGVRIRDRLVSFPKSGNEPIYSITLGIDIAEYHITTRAKAEFWIKAIKATNYAPHDEIRDLVIRIIKYDLPENIDRRPLLAQLPAKCPENMKALKVIVRDKKSRMPLRHWRKENKFSQQALAEKLGISKRTLIRWEKENKRVGECKSDIFSTNPTLRYYFPVKVSLFAFVGRMNTGLIFQFMDVSD